ncbi:hypothetical protein [uncultured Bradyrhizobium sp.]|uniref:hypothetical protein n=1 Tax=Bradyrhizobium sp. TaxID=376 RepID=UPI0026214EBA|nr:hypothetical protein [uncultured Bradyrhizobium sp.]
MRMNPSAIPWGHLLAWLIEDELSDGRLISIAGPNFPGREEHLAAIRHRQHARGPVAEALWLHVEEWRLAQRAGRGSKRLRAKRRR